RVGRRVFARHAHGLGRLLRALDGAAPPGGGSGAVPPEVAEAASLVLLGTTTREHVSGLEFRPAR
ncbi:hypothetical protein B7P34_31380, partial [Streptosporangium nondiastaticum]